MESYFQNYQSNFEFDLTTKNQTPFNKQKGNDEFGFIDESATDNDFEMKLLMGIGNNFFQNQRMLPSA